MSLPGPLTFSWTAVTGVASYQIEHSHDAGVTYIPATSVGPDTTLMTLFLDAGTVQIRVTGVQGVSYAFSTEILGPFTVTTLPDPPLTLLDELLGDLGTAAYENVGVPDGVAELDGTGKVPSSQLPVGTFPVTSVAGRTGDIVLVVTDLSDSGSTGRALLLSPDTSTARTNIGLGSINNTSDAAKPVSTATQTALDAKVTGPSSVTDDLPAIFDGTTGKLIKSKTYAAFKTLLSIVKGDVGLGSVDNTADTAKPISTAQQTALDLKAPSNSPTLVTPALGTPSAVVLTNATGLPTAGLVNDAVTYAKIQNVSATDKLLGRSTAGAGDVEEIACTAAGRALIAVAGAGQIPGTATNDDAAAGKAGELISATGGSVSLTSGAPVNSTSLTLPPGDWDVGCRSNFYGAGTTTVNYIAASLSTVSASHGANDKASSAQYFNNVPDPDFYWPVSIPRIRFTVAASSTTIVYLVVSAKFAVSTMECAQGFLTARRVR